MKSYIVSLRLLDTFMMASAFILASLFARVPLFSLPFILALVSVVLLYGGGNIINDYFDIAVDCENRAVKKSAHQGLKLSILTFLVALALAHFAGINYFLLSLLVMIMLIIYGQFSKKMGLLKNLFVAVTGSIVFLLGSALSNTPGHNYFIFLMSIFFIMSRELAKDIEDMAGDAKAGALTFPIRFGTGFTMGAINACIITGLILSIILFHIGNFKQLFTGFIILSFLILAIAYRLRNETKRYRRHIEAIMIIILFGALLSQV